MFKIKKAIQVIFYLITCIAFNSCTYEKLDTKPCEGNLNDSISFSADVLDIFRASCSTAGCHSNPIPAGSLNLEDAVAYDQLMQPGTGYINTAHPEFSVLYTQMISVSQPMPPTGKLDDCKINLILEWIRQGAKNN